MSDHANCETSARVKDILRSLMIGHWKSEPRCQHQNFAEHRQGHVKANLEWLMSFLGVDPDCWSLALNCACSVMKKIAKTQKKLIPKLRSFRSKPVCMCGFQVPRNHAEALELDRVNGSTMWMDAETTELSQIDECKSFIDKGVGFNP